MNMSWDPGQLLKTSGCYWLACTLHTSVKLDIFSIIGNNEKTSNEISLEINSDSNSTTRLLDALVSMKLLNKKDDAYKNTPEANMFLNKASEKYIGYMIMHHHHLVESWSKLDQSILTGKPVRSRSSVYDEDLRESFLMGMFNNALSIAPTIADKIDLSNRNHLLDLGGGPGTYAIHFCMKNPNLKATIFDLPSTLPFANKVISRFNINDRVSFIGGNFLTDEVTGIYDVAWLSHILHGESPGDCLKLIKKAVSVLKPGGLIIIHEFILNNSMDGPLFPALFSLNMLIGTESGQSYSEEQISEMLSKAGVKNICRISVDTPNDSGIIIGHLES